TLNPQPSTLNPQPSTLNPQPSTLNPQPSTLTSSLAAGQQTFPHSGLQRDLPISKNSLAFFPYGVYATSKNSPRILRLAIHTDIGVRDEEAL
ncbi:hypothetical protein T484DRAFT_1650221, partial [Baffinella frigidus]